MSNFLFNPSLAVSNALFEAPVSNPVQVEPKANDFEKYLSNAQKTAQVKPKDNWKAAAQKKSDFERPESTNESIISKTPVDQKAKTNDVKDSNPTKTDGHVHKQADNSSKVVDSKTASHDDQKTEALDDEDGKGETAIRKMIDDFLRGQEGQNPLAAILAQILQLLGVKNDASGDPDSGTGDLSQNGIVSAQQVIDLLKSAIAQNNVKQANITSAETKPESTKQELDALIAMLVNQNNDTAQTFQSIIADKGKANLAVSQVGLNIVTGQIEKLAAAQTGMDKTMDPKEILANIVRLLGDEKLAAQIVKDVKNVTTTSSTESNHATLPDAKAGNMPVSMVQTGDLNQLVTEDQNAKTDGQDDGSFAKSLVQVSAASGGTNVKPLNLSVIQTQLLVKDKPDNLNTSTPVTLIQNLNQHIPDQVAEVKTASVQVGSKEIFSQIIEQAKVMVSNGQNEMEINLKPENLGRIHLKVAMENQIVTAKFVAESQQVKEIIETNLSQLRSHLQESGIQVDSLMVSVGTSNQGQSFEQMANQQNGLNHSRNYNGSTRDNLVEPSDGVDDLRRAVLDSRIDLIA